MREAFYIVATDLLLTSPPRDEWHAQVIPADLTKSLVVVFWDNPNNQTDLESQPGVLFLGERWEPVPPEAVSLLASMSADADLSKAEETSTATPLSAQPNSLAAALRTIAWPGGRMTR